MFLMDCSNLTSIRDLQIIEAMLDCGYFNYEDKTKLIKKNIPKHFCFVIIYNRYKYKFYGKKQILHESIKNKFISEEVNPTETIINIHGERYISPIINEMEDILLKYKNFIFYKANFAKIKNKFSKNIFINSNVLKLICACVFSLK